MAEQDIFSLLGEDDSKDESDMNDLNPTLGVTTEDVPTKATATATAGQTKTTGPQQVTMSQNVLTGKDPMMSQGMGAAVASQLTSVQVKQMNTPTNPMWGSPQQKPQTIVVHQGGQQPGKVTVAHHDYAISGQKLTKVGGQQQQVVIQQQQNPATVQPQLQLQQQPKTIQQQLQLSQQQQQQIKQQIQQLQQKQIQLQQQQQLQNIVQQQQKQGGFQQLQGGQTITLTGLQQKVVQQSPGKIATVAAAGGSPQQTIIRLPVSLAQVQQQQQSLHITPSSTAQRVTIQQPKLATATSQVGGSPRFIITRQPSAQQGNQPVTLQLQMQDVNSLQRNVGKLQTLPGGQVLRIQPTQQQATAVQQQLTLTNVSPAAGAAKSPVRQAAPQAQRVITLTPQQLQQLIQRSQQQQGAGGATGLRVVQQNAAATTPGVQVATSNPQVVRTVVLPQATTASSVGQVLRTLVAPSAAPATAVSNTQVQSSGTAGVATQNLNLLASQAASASSAAQILQRMMIPQSVAVSTSQAGKPVILTTQATATKPVVFATQAATAAGKPIMLSTQVGAKPFILSSQGATPAGQVVRSLLMPQTIIPSLSTQSSVKTVVSTVNTAGMTAVIPTAVTSATNTGLLTSQAIRTVTTATTPAVQTVVSSPPALSSPTKIASPSSAATVQQILNAVRSPTKVAAPATSTPLQIVRTVPSQQLKSTNTAVSAGSSAIAATTASVVAATSLSAAASAGTATGVSVASQQNTATAKAGVSTAAVSAAASGSVVTSATAGSIAATATSKAPAAVTAATSLLKAAPSAQAPGGKITISAATAQMLAQKGIVLTRTPQGTFVAKIPQSMLLKAAAQGQLGAGGNKQGANILSLLGKSQATVTQGQAVSGSVAQATTTVKAQGKGGKAQPTILSKGKKGAKSPTAVAATTTVSSTATMPKLVFNIGGQQVQASIPATATSGDKSPKMVLSLKPGVSAAEEVKKIGEELGKLQGQSKTPENLQKLKDLHTKLKQLQLTVQASAVAAKAKAEAGKSGDSTDDSLSPRDDKEKRKLIKQRQLQEKANRIVAEAVAKAKASGQKDIPKIMINVKLPEVVDEDAPKPKKEKSKKSKSRPKSSKPKRPKSPKPQKPPKEKKAPPPPKKKPKKLPLAALNKLKKQRKKFLGGEESEDSEYDETPPPTPDPELSEFLEKRRSTRNTNKRKKYTEEYDFNITDDSSSSSDDGDGEKKPKDKKRLKTSGAERTTVISKESEEGENNLMIDVETVEPSEQTKFFVDNPDESQANIVEKILARRTVKKPQLPGEAQVGEVEEFFVKFRSYSYLHCEWGTQEKLLKGDPRILQKIRRYRAKQHMTAAFLQDAEDEPFNPDYIEVERVIDKAISEDPDNPGHMVTHYLIKWCSLPYEDATWEVPEDVDEEKVKMYDIYAKPPPVEERERVPRGRPGAWEKMEKSRVYKNENTLREYQLEGVNWLTFSWFNGQNCILADEMGLGKTIQALAFLEEVRKHGIRGPFLVIAPLSTIANWQREFETWTDVNCVVYHGSSQSRHMIAEYELYYKDDKGRIIPDIYKFQVLITTYEIVLADCQELSEIEWRVVIIDEAHRLKNRNCKLLEGLKILDLEHRVLLTGTPLQNNVEELFSLLNFLEPGQFRSSTQFMDEFGDLKSESQVEKLQAILRPMMLRRLKEDVEKNLAPKEETIIEVELTNIQKKYYRAILERNFNFLNKANNSSANLPNLMNTMMELRKCCNHPFLIQGAEEQIMLEFQNLPEDEMPFRHIKALVQSAGKMVLLDKLLPKLREGGHKVLIFSQMIRCLDILEDYLITKQYPFERIDGRVRGNMRQAAIDRFSKPDSDRFVFLLCTRAGGLGINLTAADTCVIFDSDWNPQNDLQAQARCHRIGQVKAVKVYRLITRNSYEREMFDKASMKLGLDKAVLQSMRTGGGEKDASNAVQPLSKNEIEDLLKRGAYGAIMDDDDAASKFCEEDIDIILQRRTQIITIDAGEKGSTFAKASFSLSGDRHASDIKLDDPDFWEKWAQRADLDVDQLKNRENLLIDAPRQRKQTRRYGNMDMVNLSSSESEPEAPQPQVPEKPSKKQLQSGWTRLECFRVEKGLLTYGWGRWNDIISTTRFKRRLGEKDIEAISRTMLIYCLLHYKGDENIKSFIWDLVTPSPDGTVKDYKNHKGLSAPVPRGRKGRKPKKEEPVVPAILEYDFNNKDQDPETLLTDQGYKNHLKRHCNKVLLRVRLLYYLKQEVIGDVVDQIEEGVFANDLPINIPAPEGEPPISWWDEDADRSLMVGVFKHGYERYAAMRNDPALCFLEKCGRPNQIEIARENSDDFNDSQLDVEGTDGPDGDGDMKPSGSSNLRDEMADSMSMDAIDKDESLSSFPPSRTNSPGPNKLKIDNNAIESCEPGKLPFPPAPDLNTRLRRLVATCQRNHKRQQMKLAKREKREHVKKIRFEEQLRQRELRKLEHAQKWSRREEADFYRILAAYGVDLDPQTGTYNWTSFKKLAKLEKKYDERMQEYYEHFRVMCLKVCKKDNLIPPDWESRPPPEFNIEGISEERANKCLHRIDLLLKIRNEVMPHPDRDRRLKRCRRSLELPEWWEPGKHDRDLIIGTARYGINRTESQLSMMNDPDLCFQELKERYPKWHLPASAFFPPAPPKTVKKEKTDKDEKEKTDKDAPPSSTNGDGASTSADAENVSAEVKDEVDPDTGEGSSVAEPTDNSSNPVQKSEADRVDESQGSSQSSLSGMDNSEMLSQDVLNNSTPLSSQENYLGGASTQETDNVPSSQDASQPMDTSQDWSEDKKPLIKTENGYEQERTSGDANIDEQNAQGDGTTVPNSEGGSLEAKQAAGIQPEFNPAEFLRWPKDRVIVHRLEQVSHCVLKGEWPGRRRHHHPTDPNRSHGANAGGGGGGDGVVTPAEHNYAGDEGREDTKTILPKKKKRRKRAEIEQERAAQLAVLLGQNPSLGLHPVFSSLMTSLPLATGQLPANMAAAAMSPLDLSQNSSAAAVAGTSAAATSRYHIHDAEFKPDDAAAMQAAVLAMGGMAGMRGVAGVQQVVHKKKKKHKLKTEGGEQVDPEVAERRRKRKLELLEKKKRRKKKQKDKAKEMSDAFNALKDDDHVPVMNPRTNERYIGPAAPMKKQLGAWMKEHPGFELLYPFHAVVSPDGTSVSFPPLPKPSQTASHSGEPPKKKKKKSQRNPAKLDPAKLTGEERVDVIDRNTGKKLPYKLNPTLNNLSEWLTHNPAFDVASEWGTIVKEKGYISEELHNRISKLSMMTKPATTSSAGASSGVLGSALSASKLSMQIGQGSLGGLGSLGLAGFSNPVASEQLDNNSAVVVAAAQQLLSMQSEGQSEVKTKMQKKKKLKTSHPVTTTAKQVQLPMATATATTPPVSGVPSLAGISPYLLPTQGGVFFSPFLASHNVQGLISATTTANTTSTTDSLDNNDSLSSVDSKINRTELGDTESEQDVAMTDGALGDFTEDNDNTFAGVDLGELEGELDENVIADIAMDVEEEA